MRYPTHYLLRGLPLAIIFLFASITSCKKDKSAEPDAPAAPVAELSATIDGEAFTVTESSITANRFEDTGDAQKSMEINSALDNNGNEMSFFIGDVQAGTTSIEPKVGTSLYSSKKNANRIQSTTTQHYIKYTSSGNVYYAVRGSVVIKIDGDLMTYTWDITFIDAAGKEFNSKGSFTITITKYPVRPKTEITNPTPITIKPRIENITPNRGMAGAEVIISGLNFSSIATENIVKFNGVAAEVKSATENKLIVIAPIDGKTGAISLKVNTHEAISGPIFTYGLQPTFTSLTPTTGKVGDTVKISGTNFSTALLENQVYFGSSALTPAKGIIVSATATSLYVKVPAGTITGPIKVTSRGTTAISALGVNTTFTILTQTIKLPTLTSLAPASGKIGDTVKITGTNFNKNMFENQVYFGTTAPNLVKGIIISATETTLYVKVPLGTLTGPIKVTVNGIQTTSATGVNTTFTVLASPISKTPTFISLAPASGKIGDTVKISGTNFSRILTENEVYFGGATPNMTKATIIGATETTLYVKVPVGTLTGPIKVTVKGVQTTSAMGVNTTFTIF